MGLFIHKDKAAGNELVNGKEGPHSEIWLLTQTPMKTGRCT